MIIINEEQVFVVHFSTTMREHSDGYPEDLLSVHNNRDNPRAFCLSCVAFTKSMLINSTITLPGSVGLIIDVCYPNKIDATCCDAGRRQQIRRATNSDAGKPRAQNNGKPCLPNDDCTSLKDLEQSLQVNDRHSHNEWIIKPPHKIIGIFLSSNFPCVSHFEGNKIRTFATSIDEVREKFPVYPIYKECQAQGWVKLPTPSLD